MSLLSESSRSPFWSHLIISFIVVYLFYFSSRQLLFCRVSLTSLILEEWSNLAAIDW